MNIDALKMILANIFRSNEVTNVVVRDTIDDSGFYLMVEIPDRPDLYEKEIFVNFMPPRQLELPLRYATREEPNEDD